MFRGFRIYDILEGKCDKDMRNYLFNNFEKSAVIFHNLISDERVVCAHTVRYLLKHTLRVIVTSEKGTRFITYLNFVGYTIHEAKVFQR